MFWGRYDRQRTLAIRIAEIALASDSAIAIARFRPSKVPENALSREFLDPSKRASRLLCRGFLYRKNRALTLRGVENVPYEGGSKTRFSGRGVSFVRFSTPLLFGTPPWRPLNLMFPDGALV